MRLLAAALLAAALAGASYGGGGGGPAPGLPSASPSPLALDADAVRRAFAATAAAGTGRYDLRAVLRIGSASDASLLITEAGWYDLPARLLRSDLVHRPLRSGTPAGPDVTHDVLTTPQAAYQRASYSHPVARGRWIRYEPADIARGRGSRYDPEKVFPGPLRLLGVAPLETIRPGTARTAYLRVPADYALGTLPRFTIETLLPPGTGDPLVPVERLIRGEVDVEVTLDEQGRVARVRLDVGAPFGQALRAGEMVPAFADSIAAVDVELTLSRLGEPVDVTVPSGADVITARDYFAASGRKPRTPSGS